MTGRETWMVLLILPAACLFFASAVWAGEPTDSLQRPIEQVLDILRDPDLKSQRELREQKVWDVASPSFDFEEISRRTLATHWGERTPEERLEFVNLFSDLLYQTYIGKIEDYTDESVEFVGEETRGSRAVVNTLLVGEGLELRVDYRMIKKPSGWLIYDVIVEDVSLVNNYRTQFNRIILSSGYEELLRRLRAKQGELGKELELEVQAST